MNENHLNYAIEILVGKYCCPPDHQMCLGVESYDNCAKCWREWIEEE